ncbi:hypothetical protein D3C78_1691040 [compost metagenome]
MKNEFRDEPVSRQVIIVKGADRPCDDGLSIVRLDVHDLTGLERELWQPFNKVLSQAIASPFLH